MQQKKDINDITHVDTSNFALKTNLSSLKTEVDKLDIDKLATVPVDLSKLSNVVKNDVVKKTVYEVEKVENVKISSRSFDCVSDNTFQHHFMFCSALF